jgi:hypothetical protein
VDFGRTLTMVCAEELIEQALMEVLKVGRFYGSTGLLMEEVELERDTIRVRLSAKANGRFVGSEGTLLSSAEDTEFARRFFGERRIRFGAEA